MDTPSKIKVINVTTDVYDSAEAKSHYYQELVRGAYLPMIWMRRTVIRGEARLAFSVCRAVLTTADRVFYDDMVELERRQCRKTTYPFYAEASADELYFLDEANELDPVPGAFLVNP